MSASSWRRLDESAYLLDEPNSDPFSPANGLDPLDTTALLSSDDDDEALSLPSAGIANVRGDTPESDEDDDDVDIGDVDWGDADKEVNDFLAELGEDAIDTDDSDNERYIHIFDVFIDDSVASNNSRRRHKTRKRKRDGDSSRETSDAEDSDGDSIAQDNNADHLRSRLAKRIHTAHSRKSALSKPIVVADKPLSAATSPNGSSHGPGGEEGPASTNGSAMDGESEGDDGDAEDSDLDDWANEFEKEIS